MTRLIPRWSVRKRGGSWRVYDHNTWAYTCDTLEQAHTAATQDAVADVLYAPGGLHLLAYLIETENNCTEQHGGR